MKYLIKLSCIILFILTLSLLTSATDENMYIYEYPKEEITIKFSATSTLSDDTRTMIADSIANDLPISQTYSWCWLLGHDTITETVTATYHKRSEYDPRCQMETYHVTSCVNCDYAQPELISSQYISCCPPEASAVGLD